MHECSYPGCKVTAPSHKWGTIKAWNEGWFFSKDGSGKWCPSHLPSWVAKWRARNVRKQSIEQRGQ